MASQNSRHKQPGHPLKRRRAACRERLLCEYNYNPIDFASHRNSDARTSPKANLFPLCPGSNGILTGAPEY